MTKSIRMTLVLVGLALGIMWVWFYDRPASDPGNIRAQNEQVQSQAADSGGSSQSRGHDAAAQFSANGPTAKKAPTAESSTSVETASGLVHPKRVNRQDSTFPDEKQPEGPAISGLVQDEEGYPLANIEVLAEPIDSSGAGTSNGNQGLETALSTLTSFDGSFVFEGLGDSEYRIRTVPLHGFATAETTARVGELTASLVLMRLWDVKIWGVVNSTEGEQIENVRVFAGPPTRTTETGPDGDYELAISIKGKRVPPIQFQRKGYKDQSVQIALAELEDVIGFPLNVSMEPLEGSTTFTGRLKAPDGVPVAGKTIKISSAKLRTSYRAQSDVRGYFSMEGVEPGKDYLLTVRLTGDYKDYVRKQLEIPAGGLQKDIVLEPLNQGEIAGFMTAVDGRPIPGIALTLKSSVAAGKSIQVVGDDVGFFTVEKFPEGSAVLKSHSYPIFTTQGFRVSSEPEEPVEVILDMGPHALFGRVTTISGDTVGGVEVYLGWKHTANGVQNYSDRKTTADQNGIFVFTGLGSGEHTIRVNPPGFNTAVMTINVGMDPDNIVVELEEKI